MPVILLFGISLIMMGCKTSPPGQLSLLKTTTFSGYPSSSSLLFYANTLYMIGDDASWMMILDVDHKALDSVQLFGTTRERLPKDIKPDLESSALWEKNGHPCLMALSSFSTSNRNKILALEILDDGKLAAPVITLDSFRIPGLKEINIEGATRVKDKLILSNRANTTNTTNYLVITTITGDTLNEQEIVMIPIQFANSKTVIGISGLDYFPEKDWLLFSASTEDTPNAYADGTIGESYIGLIRNFSTRMKTASITVDTMISLSSYLNQSKAQKIESIAVQEFSKMVLIIHLAADNDDGTSTLFKMRWPF
jgi:hypothetical protein